jgi:hypothetical protein
MPPLDSFYCWTSPWCSQQGHGWLGHVGHDGMWEWRIECVNPFRGWHDITRSPNCSPCRPNTTPGAAGCPQASAAAINGLNIDVFTDGAP